jgi:DNA-binding SARP family transcriptional activator
VAPELTFSLLGPVRARLGPDDLDTGTPQQRATLAVLLLRRGRVVPVEEISYAVWGETAPKTARAAIRTYIHRLRRALAATDRAAIAQRDGGYVLRAGENAVDTDRFRNHVVKAETLRAEGRADEAAGEWERALALWQGTPLSGLSGPYSETQRNRLEQARMAALEDLCTIEIALGRNDAAIGRLQPAVPLDPLRERLYELLMLALYRSGKQAEALQTYEQIRRLLGRELGIDPGLRLRETHQRILRSDPTLLAEDTRPAAETSSARPVPAQLPTDLPAFAGRADELAAALTRRPTVSLIHGMAGVGKTTFAVHWGHQVAGRFPDGRLYLNLRGFQRGQSPMQPAEALYTMLHALGAAAEDIPNEPDARAAMYRSVLSGRRCLILLDNAKDSAQVIPLLPGNRRCLVLVTSRTRLDGVVAATGAHTVGLNVLTAPDAGLLLRQRLGAARVDSEPEAVQDIIERCGRLPLALAITAARAAYQPHFTLADIAAELARAQGSLDAFSSGDSGADVRAVISWSYAALSVGAARLFRLLSLHVGTSFTVAAAASIVDLPPRATLGLLRELTAAHLVTELAPGRYAWHDLIRAFAAENQGDAGDALHRLLDHYRATAFAAARLLSTNHNLPPMPASAPGVVEEDLASYARAGEWFTMEYDALLSTIAGAAERGFPAHVWHLAWALRHFQDRQGHWQDLDDVHRAGLAAARSSADRLGMAYAHCGIARARTLTSDHRAAEAHVRSAITLFREVGCVLGEAYAHRQYSWILELTGSIEAALEEAAAALSLFRKAGWAPGVAAGLNAVGWYHVRLGNNQAAVTYCLEALAVFEDLDEQYGRAETLNSLGTAHAALGDHDRAIACFRPAVQAYRACGMTTDAAGNLFVLASICHHAGRAAEAEAARREALALRESLDPQERASLQTFVTLMQQAGLDAAV